MTALSQQRYRSSADRGPRYSTLKFHDYQFDVIISHVLYLMLGGGSPKDLARFPVDFLFLSIGLSADLMSLREPDENAIAPGAHGMFFARTHFDAHHLDTIIFKFDLLSFLCHGVLLLMGSL
jgi:hypothetical protein